MRDVAGWRFLGEVLGYGEGQQATGAVFVLAGIAGEFGERDRAEPAV